MQLGMIGLGRMGSSMVSRLMLPAAIVDDDIRRAAKPEPKGVHYLDVGTSGGVWGLEQGFSSRGEANFADKLLSAMRHGVGGHLEKGDPGGGGTAG